MFTIIMFPNITMLKDDGLQWNVFMDLVREETKKQCFITYHKSYSTCMVDPKDYVES
jgi:hypothetical protein